MSIILRCLHKIDFEILNAEARLGDSDVYRTNRNINNSSFRRSREILMILNEGRGR